MSTRHESSSSTHINMAPMQECTALKNCSNNTGSACCSHDVQQVRSIIELREAIVVACTSYEIGGALFVVLTPGALIVVALYLNYTGRLT